MSVLIPLSRLISRHGVTVDRVVHAGAHLGEEALAYATSGAKRVLWVEANPDLIERLRAAVEPYGHVVAQALLGAESGREVPFHVTNLDSISSSVLSMGTHRETSPEVVVVQEQRHTLSSLDEVCAANGFDGADFINLDLQGYELECLKGAKRLVATASTIFTEINVDELYQGCVLLPELDRWLNDHGFEAAELVLAGAQRRGTPGFVGWGDACYLRVPSPRPIATLYPEEMADWFPAASLPATGQNRAVSGSRGSFVFRAARYLKREARHIVRSPGDLSPSRIWDELRRLNHEAATLRRELDEVVARQRGAEANEQDLGLRVNEVDAQRILAAMTWIDAADVPEESLVSVITATWNRAELLRRAIGSVVAQSYPNWELLVADDGSDDNTAEVVAAFGDSRIRHLRLDHHGAAHARNAALRAVQGDLVAYMDSDNQLHSSWLRSVVWAMREHPEVDVVYGAQVRETDGYIPGLTRYGLPAIWFRPFARDLLATTGFMDLSCTAHRAGLPEQFFDESLVVTDDFERALRLTATKPALGIPVLASLYRVTGDDQLSRRSDVRERELARIAARLGE